MTILENVNLQPYNTFNIRSVAKYFTVLQTEQDVQELLASDLFKRTKYLFLGGGSNMLFTKDYDGLVVKVELKGILTVDEDDNTVTLRVGSGENWHSFVMYCVDRDWSGVENLSLIPGTVGAAPMQNIGAYGVEIRQVIDSVGAIELATGKSRTFNNEECLFGYRESIFKQAAKDKYLISSVTLTLNKRNHKLNTSYGAIHETLAAQGTSPVTVKRVSDAVIQIRRTKLPDPAQVGNAGSFFKNPTIPIDLHDLIKQNYPALPSYPASPGMVKIPAGWLIEQCGWKGKTFNNIGVHPHQALVLVNYGGGEGEKLWKLAMQIQQSVKEKFNITLQPEVNVIA